MAPKRRLRAPKSLTADQRAKLFAVVREGWRAKPETGYSIRQIAAAVGISKSTLSDWVLGPLDDELQAAIEKDRMELRQPTRATLGHPPDQNLDLGDVSQFQTEGAPEGPHLSYREGDVVEDYHPEWQFGGVRTSLGTRSRVAGPMFAIPPNYHGEKAPSPVHPFPDVPLVPNRRKGVKWYNDPNRK